MKQQVSPVVAVVVIMAVVGLAALGWMRFGGVRKESSPPPTMPEQVAKDWAKYTSGAGAGRGTGGSIPTGQGGPTTSPPTTGGPGGPPPGMPGGYGALPTGPPVGGGR